ncbi:MAG: hypothetical protein FWF20_08630 [Betaproteobacteria bacterium]|nr:hypothetical protein [Betaproteobacteria bacterium]MCL2886827.1 hypothetical protein [Betaproteobacteria bacterium]
MLGLNKFLFHSAASGRLPDDVRAGLAAWRDSTAPSLDEAHFQTRYLVVDIQSAGGEPKNGRLLGIAASAVRHSAIAPDATLYVDLDDSAPAQGALERRLLAFLQYAAKAPLVTYHVPYVSGYLLRTYKERLGINFQPQWIDLAWLLPAMFGDKESSLQPLDHWLKNFALDTGSGRRNAMENALLLARLLQMLLLRASAKNIDTAAQLIAESHASSLLRRLG